MSHICRIVLPALLLGGVFKHSPPIARAQSQPEPSQSAVTDDEVIRISTQFSPDGATVIDKKGAEVRDLKREDFELRVDAARSRSLSSVPSRRTVVRLPELIKEVRQLAPLKFAAVPYFSS